MIKTEGGDFVSDLPLVSIYIITHNRSELLKRAVESVRNQTYKKLEIIIVDDFSSDNTSEVVDEIISCDPRVKYIKNDLNRGACYSRNCAIKLSSGEFITGLDDDDYFLPDRVESFVNSSDLLESYSCLFSDVIWKTKSGFNKAKINNYFKRSVYFNDLLFFNFIGNQIFTKTSVFKDNLFDEKLDSWQDLDCWMSLMKKLGLPAYNVRKYNYVQDISHPHERISTSKINKVEKSFRLISLKYRLNLYERMVLKNQLIMYGVNKISAIPSLVLTLFKFEMTYFLVFCRNVSFLIFRRKR